jgi:hypothetical protein
MQHNTTIRMLTGLIPPMSGSIQLLGMPLAERELEIKRRIDPVPDESMLLDRLNGPRTAENHNGPWGRRIAFCRLPWCTVAVSPTGVDAHPTRSAATRRPSKSSMYQELQ